MSRVARWALALPLMIIPFHRGIVVRLGQTPLGMLTVPELLLDAAVLVIVIARLRGFGSGAPCITDRMRFAWIAFLGCATLSFAFHPTGFGLVAVVRLLVVGVVVGEVARRIRVADWASVTVPLSIAMVVQSIIAVVQRIHGGPLGLELVGERRTGFKTVGSTLLPAGTTVHTNTLGLYGVGVAALLLAAAVDRSGARPGWLSGARPGANAGAKVGAAARVDAPAGVHAPATVRPIVVIERSGLVACAVCIGLSGSRTAAIAVSLVVAVVVSAMRVRSRRGARTAVVTFAAALMTSVVATGSVWLGRAAQSSGASVEQLGSGRMALIRQSLAVFRLSPATGVGPGNYLVHVLTDPAIIRYSAEGAPVHNIWLAVLATYGLVGIAAFIVLTVLLLDLGRRAGLIGALIGLPVLVTLGLDVATTLSPGYLLLAVSLGAIGGVAARSDVSTVGTASLPDDPVDRADRVDRAGLVDRAERGDCADLGDRADLVGSVAPLQPVSVASG